MSLGNAPPPADRPRKDKPNKQPPSFDVCKRNALGKLDKSPKGSLDEPIAPLVHAINAHPDYVTTSCCSGRVSLFATASEQTKGYRGGRWLLVRHATCRDVEAAKRLLQVALGAGYRESGLVLSSSAKVMLAIRTTANCLELPVARRGACLLPAAYLELLTAHANEKFVANQARTDALHAAFDAAFDAACPAGPRCEDCAAPPDSGGSAVEPEPSPQIAAAATRGRVKHFVNLSNGLQALEPLLCAHIRREEACSARSTTTFCFTSRSGTRAACTTSARAASDGRARGSSSASRRRCGGASRSRATRSPSYGGCPARPRRGASCTATTRRHRSTACSRGCRRRSRAASSTTAPSPPPTPCGSRRSLRGRRSTGSAPPSPPCCGGACCPAPRRARRRTRGEQRRERLSRRRRHQRAWGCAVSCRPSSARARACGSSIRSQRKLDRSSSRTKREV
ncbi:hypothetical protein EMIHUDRAFT_449657 [Emiliania huxleyi CCMP1516]|uniref:tRNA(Phe) 7-[(3-amino-3-carboxypropyl)-4-demethylwyosine(37)-N(4)]-methyltransferase n=2 Tax=Emiliania huxleyi TaxID=2903 RepID=A0A0D3K5P8_EMIH1|nr:hypothetical protein EMIHUDRAFT_449657 [Emiliania huxleyi CCMP1516]EOD31083.1 hypothetical protein EMIHUDRAFT_449657 [Emiliania huxleyi CCMP1516]|eukprot:XP_005783512.1 hypothetical protein EMIHUDRAFT_449657 [Emiliania huxleyi CCMP1516]